MRRVTTIALHLMLAAAVTVAAGCEPTPRQEAEREVRRCYDQVDRVWGGESREAHSAAMDACEEAHGY